MGYYGRLELKQEAQKMRQEGKSYNEIKNRLNIPKTTVSDWCKNIQLTNSQLMNLYKNKKSGRLKGSIIAAKNKQKKCLEETKELYDNGIKEIGKLTKRDRFVAGVAFYAAEGTKINKGCVFANSDPAIIKFMVNWFREFGEVSDDKFRAGLWLHDDLDETAAKKFWSESTGIPIDHFYKTYIVKNKPKSEKIRKNIHSYGVFTFYVNNVVLIRKIMGWIGGILQKPMV